MALFISNIYWIFQARKNLYTINSFLQKKELIQSANETQNAYSLLQIKSEGLSVDLLTELKDENGKLEHFGNLLKKQPFTIALRYSQIGCHVCIDKKINLLRSVFPDTMMNKIIFLSKQSLKRDLVNFRRTHNLKNSFFQYDKNITPIDSLNIPYFLIVTNRGTVEKIFIPFDGINEELTKSYLGYIAQLMKDQN